MNRAEALALLESDDLVSLGMRAHEVRARLHPGDIVTYSTEAASAAERIPFDEQASFLDKLDALQNAPAVAPIGRPGMTAVEYLKTVALSRLYLTSLHIEIVHENAGLKIGQLALRFGANDFGNIKPGGPVTEEDVRRVIRDAGFVPKRRNSDYEVVYLY